MSEWQANQPMDPRDILLDHVEGGLLLLYDAIIAGDPKVEIIWRIQEEIRQVRRRHAPLSDHQTGPSSAQIDMAPNSQAEGKV